MVRLVQQRAPAFPARLPHPGRVRSRLLRSTIATPTGVGLKPEAGPLPVTVHSPSRIRPPLHPPRDQQPHQQLTRGSTPPALLQARNTAGASARPSRAGSIERPTPRNRLDPRSAGNTERIFGLAPSLAQQRREHDRIGRGEAEPLELVKISYDQAFPGCPCFACPAGESN